MAMRVRMKFDPGRLQVESGDRRIGRVSLHDVVVAKLRDMLRHGELPPGGVIDEGRLCGQFGISRTPLREAMKVLAAEGLIELRPHRTPVVSQVDPGEIASIFEVMEGLEGLAGRYGCLRADASGLDGLAALHAGLVERFEAGDRAGYARLNGPFHDRIVELAGNAALKSVHASLSLKIARARATTNYEATRWGASAREHDEIVRALRDRDPDRSQALLAAHMRATAEAVVATLLRVRRERDEVGLASATPQDA